jgi:hypothetical protein
MAIGLLNSAPAKPLLTGLGILIVVAVIVTMYRLLNSEEEKSGAPYTPDINDYNNGPVLEEAGLLEDPTVPVLANYGNPDQKPRATFFGSNVAFQDTLPPAPEISTVRPWSHPILGLRLRGGLKGSGMLAHDQDSREYVI